MKLLRLRGEGLHLVSSKMGLKRQNLKILCLSDLLDQRGAVMGFEGIAPIQASMASVKKSVSCSYDGTRQANCGHG